MKPDLTLFSDASIMFGHKAAGWGMWAKGDGRPSLTAFGSLPYTTSSNIAELEALDNAIRHASAAGYFRLTDKRIMLQTDSMAALSCILQRRPYVIINDHAEGVPIMSRRKKSLDARSRAALQSIFTTLDTHSLTPILRHVRGHQSGEGRNWVNGLCDNLAKRGARQAANQ